jgi:hypothetical protein
MLRRFFLAGIDNRHWTLIKSLHENAKSSVKWDGNISEPFNVNQGVQQGDILSTDLYIQLVIDSDTIEIDRQISDHDGTYVTFKCGFSNQKTYNIMYCCR